MRGLLAVALIACLAIAVAGCEGISKPYIMKMDRVDQNLETGNRGYLKGTPPPPGDRGDLKRSFIAVDIDLPSVSGGDTSETRVERKSAPVMKESAPILKKEIIREEEIK